MVAHESFDIAARIQKQCGVCKCSLQAIIHFVANVLISIARSLFYLDVIVPCIAAGVFGGSLISEMTLAICRVN
jgi:uncharacterized membrane protein